MKWIGLAAIVLALLGAGMTGRPGERRDPGLPDAIADRIAIGLLVVGGGGLDAADSITIAPADQAGPQLWVRPIRRAGSAGIDRPLSGPAAGKYWRSCVRAPISARCQQHLSPPQQHYP